MFQGSLARPRVNEGFHRPRCRVSARDARFDIVMTVMVYRLSGEPVDGQDHVRRAPMAWPPFGNFNDSERKHGLQATPFNKVLLRI